MPDQDPESGNLPTETPLDSGSTPPEPSSTMDSGTSDQGSPEQRSSEDGSEEIAHDNTPINRVSDALKAFEEEKTRANATVPGTPRPTPQTPKARDYSGLPPEVVPLFKNMGGRSFDVMKPMFLEHQQLKKELETLKSEQAKAGSQSFYEHEHAYQVSPDFQAAREDYNSLGSEIQFWQQQLSSVRANGKWTPLVLDAKGNPVVGAEQDPSPDAESLIISQLQQAHILRNEAAKRVQQIQTSFSSGYKNFVSQMQAVEKEIFKGADTEVLNRVMQTKLPLFPKFLHSDPKIQIIAKLLAVNEGFAKLLDQQKAEQTTRTIKARTAANAGPSSGEMLTPTATPGQKVKDVMSEFSKARAMGIA